MEYDVHMVFKPVLPTTDGDVKEPTVWFNGNFGNIVTLMG